MFIHNQITLNVALQSNVSTFANWQKSDVFGTTGVATCSASATRCENEDDDVGVTVSYSAEHILVFRPVDVTVHTGSHVDA